MRKQLLKTIGIAAVLFAAASVNAAEVNLFKAKGEYGQVPYTYTPGIGWANGTVSVDGSGENRTANLFYASYTVANGYNFWRGDIPVDAVTVNGVDQISVEIDTCSISNVGGCGYVNFSVRKDVPAGGWINNGAWRVDYDDYHAVYSGNSQVRYASSTGEILGIPVDNSRAFIGKMNEVTIEVTVGH